MSCRAAADASTAPLPPVSPGLSKRLRRVRRGSVRIGFTLIEVLIAVAILALISTLIMTSFSSLQKSKEGVSRISERYRQGRLAMARMTRELQSAYISKHLPLDDSVTVWRTAFTGEPESPAARVNFTAFVHRRLDRDVRESDQVEVSYFGLESPTERGAFDLVRRFNPRIDTEPESGGRVQVLATDVDSFEVEYLDALTGLWTDRWDSTEAVGQLDRLPLQVRIKLVLKGGTRVRDSGERGTIEFSTKVPLPIQQPLTFAIQ